MHSVSLGVTRSAALLLASGLAACVTVMPSSQQERVPGLSTLPAAERQQVLDSLDAASVAEADGPRVRISANFSNEAGSRRVEALVSAEDDAYILVGHIDANGRLKVVFPTSPDDDGFVRGGHSYRIPPFFGGFADEYTQRRARYYSWLMSSTSRRDSYDAGSGYVFVIAAWRPMDFSRVSDGHRFSSYELTNDEYLTDPRDAVDELAATIAGDSREAYSVEYAHYMSTNSGMYSANFYDRCSFATGASMSYAPWSASPFGGLWSPFGSYRSAYYGGNLFFGYGLLPTYGMWSYASYYDASTGCSYYEPVYRPVFFGIANAPVSPSPVVPLPGARGFQPGPLLPPRRFPVPQIDTAGAAGSATGAAALDYRRRGLIVEAGGANDLRPMSPRTRGGNTAGNAALRTRPTIEQMVRSHEMSGATRARGGDARPPRFETPRDAYQPRFQSPARMQQPRSDSPRPVEHQYTAPVRMEPAAPRMESPRMESPRMSPPPAPAPAPAPAPRPDNSKPKP